MDNNDQASKKGKRKAETVVQAGAKKRKSRMAARPKEKQNVWPVYFEELFKVYKALNTVLAFVTSRKHMATTFPVVRSSVENLLKRPLELVQVAEIKALLPGLIKFAYIPQHELRINEPVQSSRLPKSRAISPDYSLNKTIVNHSSLSDDEEHVLVLEFVDSSKSKPNSNFGSGYLLPPSLTPAGMKKLVENRNVRFQCAVDELISATPDSEDPVSLLRAASRDHIPVDPKAVSTSSASLPELHDIPKPENRPAIEEVIGEIQSQDWYREQITETRIFEEKEGTTAELEEPLSPTIRQALESSRKITSLYTHQAAAITALTQGRNVIVSTSTASGKSVIYQVPLLRFLEEDRYSTAIFVYPTKALAQDQKAALQQLLFACPGLEHINVATYDGDTPQDQRAEIRQSASVIFTNFDMIHAAILPHEDLWRRFLKNMKLMAVDELHYYSGLFGSHVAQILRRFRRVCAAVGNRRARFVSCSATISKPLKHMKNIFGVENIVEITDDGAPSGRKHFLIWKAASDDPDVPDSCRQTPLSEATRLMRYLMKRGVRVILFCKIRKTCELVMKTIRNELSADGRLDILKRVKAYRGGYSQEERRNIEADAFSGNLLGIIATNALELGVDIGVLDAVIILGFPFNKASFRQQAGRAGRRARDSLAVLVAESLPIDQRYVGNPDELFNDHIEDLVVDLESKVILEAHLQCASHEMPVSLDDEVYFGPSMKEICETRLVKDQDGWYHTHPKFLPAPSKHIAIRGAEEEKYAIVDVTKEVPTIIEEIEISRATFEIYEGGVFVHQGLIFVVKEVNHDSKIAKIVRAEINWVTKPRDFTWGNVDATQTQRIREIKLSPHKAYYGRVELMTKVYGFYKIRGNKILDAVDLETEPWHRTTTGFWIDVPKPVLELLRCKHINAAESIHSAQHAFLNRFDMASDLKTECKLAEKEYRPVESARKRPGRLIFYDPAGKYGSVASKAFDHVSNILRAAFEAVDACECEDGCYRCVQSGMCKAGNQVCSKLGALIILKGILGIFIDSGTIPELVETEPNTIVDPPVVRLAEDVEMLGSSN